MKSRKKKKKKKNIEMQHFNWNSILEPNVATNLGRREYFNLSKKIIKLTLSISKNSGGVL